MRTVIAIAVSVLVSAALLALGTEPEITCRDRLAADWQQREAGRVYVTPAERSTECSLLTEVEYGSLAVEVMTRP